MNTVRLMCRVSTLLEMSTVVPCSPIPLTGKRGLHQQPPRQTGPDALPCGSRCNLHQSRSSGVGETEASAKAKGIDFESISLSMRYSGRYVAETEGGTGSAKC